LRFLSREMDEPVAVHRLNGHDFVVLSARWWRASGKFV
jgi:hypothetical protein